MPSENLTDLLRAVGIVQEGDPVLLEAARPFVFPAEVEEASRVVRELTAAADRVAAVYDFAKGMGIAAPQVGEGRAAAMVRPPGLGPLVLLNPVVLEKSTETDEQFEGCLSFFDVRGLVPRALALRVAYDTLEGVRCVSVFERGLARLVAHKVDHLAGTQYRARIRPGVDPIPVREYRGSGAAWSYEA